MTKQNADRSHQYSTGIAPILRRSFPGVGAGHGGVQLLDDDFDDDILIAVFKATSGD